jgi:aspartyl-tRNA(Asn)/glutamyl-tRNA(Gln) amidotransferase subunit C
MSEISKKEVEHIAGLARIRLGEHDKEKMAAELGAILGYIDKLKEVNTDGVEPIAHIAGLENVFRKDEPSKKPLEDQAADAVKLVEMAPESKDNFVKVKAVFQDSEN